MRIAPKSWSYGACVLFLLWQGAASAEPSTRGAAPPASLAATAPPPPQVRLDASGKPAYLSRFSDGPRRVPAPRGAPLLVAERLGIGSTDVARMLLHSGPSPDLVRAVPGDAPKTLLWPVVHGRFGRGFGFTRKLRPDVHHNGVDIGAPEGTIVRAAADGLVVYSDNGLVGYGNCVMILHPKGMLTLYAHNHRTTVQAGYFVKRGERIALVGRTGYAWGPHLHFELRQNGKLRDPMGMFRGKRSDEVNGPLVSLDPRPWAVRVAQPPTAVASRSTSGARFRTLLPSAAGLPERNTR